MLESLCCPRGSKFTGDWTSPADIQLQSNTAKIFLQSNAADICIKTGVDVCLVISPAVAS